MSTQLQFGSEARKKMKEGIDIVANAVIATLGPKGRNVTIQQQHGQPPFTTKDGVTVSQNIRSLSDPYQDSGAQFIKAVARKTHKEAGDGTTTSTLLTQYMITAGMKLVDAGTNPVDLKRGMDKAVIDVVANIKTQSIQIESTSPEVFNIATISANNDEEIGKLIAEAVSKVGNDGLIQKQESRTTETYVELITGLSLDKGYVHPAFITDQVGGEAVLENAYILMYPKKISVVNDILKSLEYTTAAGAVKRSLLIVADNVDSEAMATLVQNKINGRVRVCVIKCPGYGSGQMELLEDLAVMTKGKVVNEEYGHQLSKLTVDFLGAADKIIVKRDSTIIIGGAGKFQEIETRAASLRTLISNPDTNPHEISRLGSRLAKITGGMAMIHVGGHGEVEVKEKMDRVDDALCATKAALEEGIVAGGGVVFIRANAGTAGNIMELSGDEKKGYNLILDSCSAPLRQICINAGVEYLPVLAKVLDGAGDWGYNAKTDTYGLLLKMGVIDPAKVVRTCIENSASVAGMFLTTEASMVEVPEK